MGIISSAKLLKEEQVVAELSALGIRYLSRFTDNMILHQRKGWELLSDLAKQPSSRVRTAAIALFLQHPEYANQLPEALGNLRARDQMTLKLFYTAAVFLQRIYYKEFQNDKNFSPLPDLYSIELNLQEGLDPEKSLDFLGKRHQDLTGIHVNWTGTYRKTAINLLNRRKLEVNWNQ